MDEQERTGARVRVRWDLIDRRVGPFTAESVAPLLSAAIDSPLLATVREPLWLAWTRVLRRPPSGTRSAGLEDLLDLVAAGTSADPRPQLPLIGPADPRLVVRYRCSGARLRVHPGNLEHPLVFLRSDSMVAAAIDPHLVRRLGFGLGDVIELTLRVGDSYLSHLSPMWPAGELPADGEDPDFGIDGLVTEAEVSAVAHLQELRLTDVADACSHPEQAALALRWLTCGHRGLRMSIGPGGLSLGPVLAVATDGGTVPVPAALLTQTLLAASARLTALAARDRSSLRTLRAFTSFRMEDLLRGPAKVTQADLEDAEQAADGGREPADEFENYDWAGAYPAFVGAAFSGVITGYLGRENLWKVIDEARQSVPLVIAEAAAQADVALTVRPS